MPRWSQLATVWQAKARFDSLRQGRRESLTNLRSKLIYPSGTADPATVQYASEFVGYEHIGRDLDDRGWKALRGERLTGRSPGTPVPARDHAAAGCGGDALLIHGHPPPCGNHRRRRARTAAVNVSFELTGVQTSSPWPCHTPGVRSSTEPVHTARLPAHGRAPSASAPCCTFTSQGRSMTDEGPERFREPVSCCAPTPTTAGSTIWFSPCGRTSQPVAFRAAA